MDDASRRPPAIASVDHTRQRGVKYLIVIEPTSTTRKEAERNMLEPVELHLEGLRKEGYPVPEPSTSSAYVEITA